MFLFGVFRQIPSNYVRTDGPYGLSVRTDHPSQVGPKTATFLATCFFNLPRPVVFLTFLSHYPFTPSYGPRAWPMGPAHRRLTGGPWAAHVPRMGGPWAVHRPAMGAHVLFGHELKL